MALSTGQTLQNRYRIVGSLGQGGMGAVYRAWDMRLRISVALKEMVPQPGLDTQTLAGLRQQFQQEAQILARLTHPHLVRVGDFFEEGSNTYLVMDFVEGESLASTITREGSLPESVVVNWATQLLDALTYCHSQGIIHRDIKPQNVIIRPDGQAMLVDFGLVKLWDPRDPHTRTAMRGMGTPEYAPPEQYDTKVGHTDPRSDLYSLGATIYHALTGQAPPTATMRIASPGDYLPPRAWNPNISPRMEAVVVRATELAIDRRYSSASAMAAALSGKGPIAPAPVARAPIAPAPVARAQQQPVRTGPPKAPPPPRRKGVPGWAWALGGLVVLLVIVGVAIAGLLVLGGGGGLLAAAPTEQVTRPVDAAGFEGTGTPTKTPRPSPTAAATAVPSPTPELEQPAPTATRTPAPAPTTEPPTPTTAPTLVPTKSAPTATPPPAATNTPAPTETPTPAESAGPLSFPKPMSLDGWEAAEGGGYKCLIIVRISGGAAPFAIKHDVFSDTSQEREYYLNFNENGCTIVHTIRVDSADGQSVSQQYYISSPWCP